MLDSMLVILAEGATSYLEDTTKPSIVVGERIHRAEGITVGGIIVEAEAFSVEEADISMEVEEEAITDVSPIYTISILLKVHSSLLRCGSCMPSTCIAHI